MRPTAPPSRPYGRYAIGLRPSLDPDAYFDAPTHRPDSRLRGFDSAELNEYLLETSARLVVESAKGEAADLRALLQFLYLRQVIDTDLALRCRRWRRGAAHACRVA
jgi:hypothetical protein